MVSFAIFLFIYLSPEIIPRKKTPFLKDEEVECRIISLAALLDSLLVETNKLLRILIGVFDEYFSKTVSSDLWIGYAF